MAVACRRRANVSFLIYRPPSVLPNSVNDYPPLNSLWPPNHLSLSFIIYNIIQLKTENPHKTVDHTPERLRSQDIKNIQIIYQFINLWPPISYILNIQNIYMNHRTTKMLVRIPLETTNFRCSMVYVSFNKNTFRISPRMILK